MVSFKVNWDAVVDKENSKMGVGVVVQDSMGEVLASFSTPKDHIIAPDIAEAMAALCAAVYRRELEL
jgi:hypothetical protein